MSGLVRLDVKRENPWPLLRRFEILAKVKQSKHFFFNKRSKLVHRPKRITIYQSRIQGQYWSIGTMCGLTFGGSQEKFDITNDLSEQDVVCLRCERASVYQGQPKSVDVCGLDHVHIGGLKLYRECCDD